MTNVIKLAATGALALLVYAAAPSDTRAMAAGGFKEVEPALAEEARTFLLQPSIVRATFAYWLRRADAPSAARL